MPKLDVALCITELDVGGAERCLVELATRLDRQWFEPVVYVLAPPPRANLSLVSALEAADIETHFLGLRRKWALPQAVHRLTRLFKQQRPAVVQSFLYHANIAARLAARRAGVPAVVSGIRVAERRSRLPLRIDRLTDRLVDRHVCVSRSVAQFAETQAGLPKSKLVVIPNGIDVEKYTNVAPADLQSAGITPERRLVTYLGRLDTQKGLLGLLDGVELWLAQSPDCDLVLAGEGPQHEALQHAAARTSVAQRIHFLGFRRDTAAILARSELLVLPSRWEGMPNVVLEAMAAGLPVVSTDVEGVAELLGPGAAAQSVTQGDTKTFAAKVLGFLNDPAQAKQQGRENRHRAENHFSIAQSVEAYQSLWTELVK